MSLFLANGFRVIAQKVLKRPYPTLGSASTKGNIHLWTQTIYSVSDMWGYNHTKFYLDWWSVGIWYHLPKIVGKKWKKKKTLYAGATSAITFMDSTFKCLLCLKPLLRQLPCGVEVAVLSGSPGWLNALSKHNICSPLWSAFTGDGGAFD